MIVGLVVVSASWSMNTAARSKYITAEQPFEAALFAKEIYELAQTLPREPSGVPGATSVDDIVALDSLAGAVFSPPIHADRTVDSAASGWTQQVQLDLFSLDNLTTKTAENVLLGVDKTAQRLFKLHVTILHENAVVESYEWWITP